MTNSASAGSATGPPCTRMIASGFTASAAAAQPSSMAGTSSSFSAVCAPIAPPASADEASVESLHRSVWSRTQTMLATLMKEWSAANEDARDGRPVT